MKTKFLNIALASVLLAVTSVANAGVITLNNSAGIIKLNNTTEVGAAWLNDDFSSFYDYRNAGSNTGFEKEATAVMFLAEYNGDLALYTLLDQGSAITGAQHGTRTADLSISNFNPANVVLVDDSNEMTASGFSWAWDDLSSDGMVYKIDNANDFNLDLVFSNLTGFSSITFLSFPANGDQPTVIDVSSYGTQDPVDVPEPSTLAIFALGLMGFAARRFKKTA